MLALHIKLDPAPRPTGALNSSRYLEAQKLNMNSFFFVLFGVAVIIALTPFYHYKSSSTEYENGQKHILKQNNVLVTNI